MLASSSIFNDLFLLFVLVSTATMLKKGWRFLGECRERSSVISVIRTLMRK